MDDSQYTFAQGVSDVKNSLLSLIGARNAVRNALADGKPAGSDNAPTTDNAAKKLNPMWIVGGAVALVLLLKVAK